MNFQTKSTKKIINFLLLILLVGPVKYSISAEDPGKELKDYNNIPFYSDNPKKSSQISNTGAFDYSYEIKVPPGRNNFQPSVVFKYNSNNSKNGIVGVGWSLNMGSISSKEPIDDAAQVPPLGIGFTVERGGIRSDLKSAPFKSTDPYVHEFVEKNSLTYNKYYYNSSFDRWTEVSQDGVVWSYSSRQDANSKRKNSNWYLDKVAEPAGNYYTIDYIDDIEYKYVSQIKYSMFGSNVYYMGMLVASQEFTQNIIKFHYDERTDKETICYLGAPLLSQRNKILTAISVSCESGLARAYKFNYELSDTTNRSWLSSIQEIGNNSVNILSVSEIGAVTGGTPFPPTSFERRNTPFTIDTGRIKMEAPWNADSFHFVDLNGDGRTDICSPSDNNSLDLKVYLSKGDGFEPAKNWPKAGAIDNWDVGLTTVGQDVPVPFYKPDIGFADFNADGKSDFWYVPKSDKYSLNVRLSNGQGFDEVKSWATNIGWDYRRADLYDKNRTETTKAFRDFNGDGAADLWFMCKKFNIFDLCSGVNNTISAKSFVRLSNRNNQFSSEEFLMNSPKVKTMANWCWDLIDINNDGYIDQLINIGTFVKDCEIDFKSQKILTQVSGETDHDFGAAVSCGLDALSYGAVIYETKKGKNGVADHNGDGYPDAWGLDLDTKKILIRHQNGTSVGYEFVDKYWNIPTSSSETFIRFIGLIDINGDNKADFISLKKSSGGYSIYVNYSTGNNQTLFNSTSVRLTEYLIIPNGYDINWVQFAFADFTGDGMLDLLYRIRTPFKIISLHQNKPDLLSKITSSTGLVTNIIYAPYNPYRSDLPEPTQPEISNLSYVPTVVESISVSDGIQITPSVTRYKYKNGNHDFLNRQFLGFEKVYVENPDSSYQVITYNNIIERIAGLPISIKNYENYDMISNNREYETINYSWHSPGRPLEISHNYFENPLNKNNTAWSLSEFEYDDYGKIDLAKSSGSGINGKIINDHDHDFFGYPKDILCLSHVTLYDNDKIIREKKFDYYSQSSTRGAPLRSVQSIIGLNNNPIKYYFYTTPENPDYDRGMVRRITDERGFDTKYTYESSLKFISKTTNSEDHITENISFDYRFGLPTVSRDPNYTNNSKETKYTYDPFGRVERIDYPDGGIVQKVYKDGFNIIIDQVIPSYEATVTRTSPNTSQIINYEYYDGLGRVVESINSSFNSAGGVGYSVKHFVYDNMGRIKSEIGPFFSNSTNYISKSQIDTMLAARNDIPVASNFYDKRGRLDYTVKPDGSVVSYEYAVKSNGISVKTIDEDQKEREEIKDALGRIVEVIEYNNQKTLRTAYTYNGAGDLTSVKDPKGNITLMAYDKRGLLEEMKDPDLGHWKYRYDPAGNLMKKEFYTDGGTTPVETVSYEYDKINRIKNVSYSKTPDQNTAYTYDLPDLTNSQNYIGRLFTVTRDGIVIKNNEYDPLGRLMKVTKTIDGQNFVSRFTYDWAARITSITYPDSNNYKISYKYHPGTKLVERVYRDTGVGSEESPLAKFTEYTVDDKIKTIEYLNGVNTKYTYEYAPLTMRLSDIVTKKGDLPPYMSQHYTYTPAGDMESKTDNVAGSKYEYKYDGLHRLIKEVYTPPTGYVANQVDILSFTYPPDNTSLTSPKVGFQPHAPKSVKYQFGSVTGEYQYNRDAKGNTTGTVDLTDPAHIAPRTIHYLDDNMPEEVIHSISGTTRFRYDGNGKRTVKENGAQKTLYIDNNYEIINGVKTRYVFAGNVRVAEITGDSSLTTRYYHKDHLGSSTVMTDGGGNKVSPINIDYMAYGLERNSTEQLGAMNYRYTDQEKDKGTGLYNYDARLYDPGIGMFVTGDDVTQDWFDPQGLNRYAYCRNNPVNYTDPSGHSAEPFTGTITAATGYVGVGIAYVFSRPAIGLIWLFDKEGAARANQGMNDAFRKVLDIHTKYVAAPAIAGDAVGLGVRVVSNSLSKPVTEVAEEVVDASMEVGKARNKPPLPLKEAEGRPHSIIEKPGKDGQYTTHYGDGTWKQYRGSGKDHGKIPRPNVKEAKKNVTPDGREFIDKGRVRPPHPDEIPGG